jgi:hypothetical protein
VRNIELAGFVADDDGLGQQAMGPDASPKSEPGGAATCTTFCALIVN